MEGWLRWVWGWKWPLPAQPGQWGRNLDGQRMWALGEQRAPAAQSQGQGPRAWRSNAPSTSVAFGVLGYVKGHWGAESPNSALQTELGGAGWGHAQG